MGKQKRFTPEQIVMKLREAEVFIGSGSTIAEGARKLGVSEQTDYRSRSLYNGMKNSQAKKLKAFYIEPG